MGRYKTYVVAGSFAVICGVVALVPAASALPTSSRSHAASDGQLSPTAPYVMNQGQPDWAPPSTFYSPQSGVSPADSISCVYNESVLDIHGSYYWTNDWYAGYSPFLIPEEGSSNTDTSFELCHDLTTGFWWLWQDVYHNGNGYIGVVDYNGNYYLSSGGAALSANEEFAPQCQKYGNTEIAALDYRLPWTNNSYVGSWDSRYNLAAVYQGEGYNSSPYHITNGPDTLC